MEDQVLGLCLGPFFPLGCVFFKVFAGFSSMSSEFDEAPSGAALSVVGIMSIPSAVRGAAVGDDSTDGLGLGRFVAFGLSLLRVLEAGGAEKTY